MLFTKQPRTFAYGLALAAVMVASATVTLTAKATIPPWLQHVVGASTIETALYRAMTLPTVQALYPRPPKEAQGELTRLIGSTPDDAELYELRARAHEQSLDETNAEADWKLYAARAKDPVAGQLHLADFYQRRMMVAQEVAALTLVASAPPEEAQTYAVPTQQRSWVAFDRLVALASDQALSPSQTVSILSAFLQRYPDQPAVYALNLKYLLSQKDFTGAEAIVGRYRTQFPQDPVFPIRAEALIASRRGDVNAALDVYDHGFQPLWPPELVQSYFALLEQTHRQRAFVADARAKLAAHPDGPEALNALTRIFYYDQQAGRLDAAQRTLDAFRVAREARNGAWTPLDLYTLASLTGATHSYAEAARYNFAMAASPSAIPNGEPAAQAGLAGLVHILLEAPDQPLALGSQNLSLYRDIATLDQGPGYWNGILSLWLNGTSPQSAYNDENAKAQSYFHRAKAAELLADLDHRFPSAPERPALHAELIQALAQYGEPAAVTSAGKDFFAAFPNAPERLDVASAMADAYAQQNDTASEFALYDAQLAELAARTNGLPLTAGAPDNGVTVTAVGVTLQDASGTYSDSTAVDPTSVDPAATDASTSQAKQPPLVSPPVRHTLPEAVAYSKILDRYLGRLTATGNLPRALTVLRTQLDRNPNDPLLYEKLATFLQQNNLSAQQEQAYQLAIAHFQKPTWYHKLARLYLREKKQNAFATLTRLVTDIFSGTELDSFFAAVNPAAPVGPQLALQLNQYAAKRFPHDLVFTRNLLAAYQAKPTANAAAYEALLRHHWWESDDLQTQFFTYLSRTGKLQAELTALNQLDGVSQTSAAPAQTAAADPAALRELAQIDIFTAHFEQAAAPLSAVADLYPVDPDLGDQAVSLFRSFAYLDATQVSTTRAVALEANLLQADPDNPERLATLGDLYAEATSNGGENLTAAAPYWQRMPGLHPGTTQGYLTSATIFWDYFQYDAALTQLTAARSRFQSPSLFAYEAGAIEENRRNLPAAVAEYTNAVLHPLDTSLKVNSFGGVVDAFFKPPSDASDSNLWSAAQSFVGTPEANGRLLTLAKRPATKALVDSASAKAFADSPTNPDAITLRADVISAQHAAPELTPLLTSLFDQALAKAITEDQAAQIGTLALARNLTPVYERALAKEASLTLDPVEKIQLQYTLSQSREARNDIPGATTIIDSVYRANPRILGVIRATTDFYARTKQPQRAIATLLEASKAATPDLARDFTLEAATRANDANDPAQARTLANGLLVQMPYDARVLNIISTSYARAHDEAGLKTFYLARLDAARTDPKLTPDARKQDIALLRRGLIPALTRSGDFEGAVAQYIALLSAFPDDSGTAQEAALYALKHNRQPQLLDFLRTTVKQSPRDSRFAILLAQTETTLEDLPAAEAAYNQAIAIRKDRVDLYSARVDLELKLSQADPAQSELAAADFNRLYLLTYHDPTWMLRLAELRARQQRSADAVKALEAAYITGHAKAAKDYFTVADQLSHWNLLAEARTYADQGVALAGADLLTPATANADAQTPAGAVVYARILTRLGKADEALAKLTAARRAADVAASSPSALAAELARENLTGDDADAFRKNFAITHRQAADAQLTAAVTAIGATVQAFYTPEQKLVFAQVLDRMHDAAQTGHNASLALQAASAAGFSDREAAWRKQLLLTAAPGSAATQANLQAYVNLQQQRLAFADLAATLEAYAARVKPADRNGIRQQAAQAFRDAGDVTNEARLERSLVLANNTDLRDRFFDLLLRRDPAALTAFASSKSTSLADAAVNYAVAHASEEQALATVAARGQTLPVVWRPASASLVETYFATPKSTFANVSDFTQPLASDSTIANRIGVPADPTKQLTGDTYFYYAARFGIFLATVPRAPSAPPAEDFLPAELEQSPSSLTAYANLARSYAEAGNIAAALAEYNHALELSASDPALEDEIAIMLFGAGRKEEAATHWHSALAILHRMQQHAIYPETFFTSLEAVINHIGQRHLTPAFRGEIETVIGPYLAKNGNYRSNELLKAAYTASATPAEGAAFILTLANYAADPGGVFSDLSEAKWLSAQASQTLLLRRLELAQKTATSETNTGFGTPDAIRQELLLSYMANHQDAQAQALLATVPAKLQSNAAYAEQRMVLAAHAGQLDALLAGFRASPDDAPADSVLTAVADDLTKQAHPDNINARALREYVFDNKQLAHTLIPTDFLALAQARIDTNDLAGALTLLRRLTLQPVVASDPSTGAPDPYANTDSAAALLETAKYPAEAIPFLESLVQSVPWNAGYRLRLGEAQLAAGAKDKAQPNLLAVAHDPLGRYELRVQAAHDLAGTAPDLGSRELNLIAHPGPIEAARQPYFAAARIAAANAPATSPADRNTLLREAIAIHPSGVEADRARLNLLLAQSSSADPSVTLAILKSIQNTSVSTANASADNASDTDADTATADDTAAPDSTGSSTTSPAPAAVAAIDDATLPPLASTLDLPTRIRLATQLASAYERDGDLASALSYAQLAVTLDKDSAKPDPALTTHRKVLTAALTLDRRNALRRPTLHSELAQSTQVRPRLAALSGEDIE